MKTSLSCAGAALLGLLGATGCGASTSTPDDLARTVVGYLAANDFDGYLANTVMTAEQGFEICPAAESFSLKVTNFREKFDRCHTAFDFTSASVTTVSPSLETSAAGSKGCGNTAPLNTADGIEVTVTGDAGTYSFKIDDSIETLDGWRQLEDLRCSGPTPNCDKLIVDVQGCCDKAQTADGKSSCNSVLDTIRAAQSAASTVDTDCNVTTIDCASFP